MYFLVCYLQDSKLIEEIEALNAQRIETQPKSCFAADGFRNPSSAEQELLVRQFWFATAFNLLGIAVDILSTMLHNLTLRRAVSTAPFG